MEQTYYYQYPDGSIVSVVASGTEPTPPEGATVLTKADYDTAVTQHEQARQQRDNDTKAAEAANARSDYDALIAAGIPEATARRLSGHTPAPTEGN